MPSSYTALNCAAPTSLHTSPQDHALQPLREEVQAAAAAAAASVASGTEFSLDATGAVATRAISARKTASRATRELGAGGPSAADAPSTSGRASSCQGGRQALRPGGRSAPRPWETAAVTVLPDVVTEPSRQYFRKWYAVRFVDGGQPAVYNNWPVRGRAEEGAG